MKSRSEKIVLIIAFSAIVFAFISYLSRSEKYSGNILHRLELLSYDWRVRFAHNIIPPAEDKLGFVFISDESIDAVAEGSLGYRYGLYWPRAVYGYALRELTAEGAKAVAFDVLFANLRPDHEPVKDSDGSVVSSDEFFARQIKKHGGVILAGSRGVIPPPLFTTNAWTIASITGEKDPDGVLRKTRAFEEFQILHPLLKLASRIESNKVVFTLENNNQFILNVDEEGYFKLSDLGESPPPGTPDKQKVYTKYRLWNLGVALAAYELGLDLNSAEIYEDKIVFKNNKGEQKIIPCDKNYFIYIDWRLLPTDKGITAEAIENLLEKDKLRQSSPEVKIHNRWKNKLVIIGSIATGNDLTDLGATPIEKETYLVSANWNIARSILDGKFIIQASVFNEILILIALCVISGWLTWRLNLVKSLPLIILIAAGYLATAFMVFTNHKLWLPVASPVIMGLFLTATVVIAYRSIFEEKEQRRIKEFFSKLIAPEVVKELLKYETLSLGGARRKITVLFSDIRGFTEFTDRVHSATKAQIEKNKVDQTEISKLFDKNAEDTLKTVNLYLSTISDIVKEYKGTLDKYIGDCVMAFWGAPSENEYHAVLCVKAAIKAQKAIAALNEERMRINQKIQESGSEKSDPLPILEVGIGINTGYVTVGLMGSEKHILNYTVFGREVNIASRLESVAGHGRIIISEATYQELAEKEPKLAALCKKLEPVFVKGIKEPVKIYEVDWKNYTE